MFVTGIAIDGGNSSETLHSTIALLKKVGKVSILADYIKGSFFLAEFIRLIFLNETIKCFGLVDS